MSIINTLIACVFVAVAMNLAAGEEANSTTVEPSIEILKNFDNYTIQDVEYLARYLRLTRKPLRIVETELDDVREAMARFEGDVYKSKKFNRKIDPPFDVFMGRLLDACQNIGKTIDAQTLRNFRQSMDDESLTRREAVVVLAAKLCQIYLVYPIHVVTKAMASEFFEVKGQTEEIIQEVRYSCAQMLKHSGFEWLFEKNYFPTDILLGAQPKSLHRAKIMCGTIVAREDKTRDEAIEQSISEYEQTIAAPPAKQVGKVGSLWFTSVFN